jgi:heat shock protein HtpX
MGNIMMAVNNYSSLTCQCGMKIKIPPAFGTNRPEVTCPRCGTVNKVAVAERMRS